ncbi:hypothetical protein EC5412_3728, partial [Escherichia coli 5412]
FDITISFSFFLNIYILFILIANIY